MTLSLYPQTLRGRTRDTENTTLLRRRALFSIFVLCAALVPSCQGKSPIHDDSVVEGDADSDADTDSDPDRDTDADSDTDADGDCDADSLNVSDSWVQVSAGFIHACGIKADGSLRCWGGDINDYGATSAPDGTFARISVGSFSSCGIRTDGSIDCWGRSTEENPPDGTFLDLSDSNSSRRCAVDAGGQVVCWGNGDLDDVPQGEDFIDVEVSGSNICALTEGGELRCTGDNEFDQLRVPPGHEWVDFGVGADFVCGLSATHEIICWGDDYSDVSIYSPLDAPEGDFVQLDSDIYGSCAVATDGSVHCWGAYNTNPGGSSDSMGPFIQADRGGNDPYVCAIAADTSLSCWGLNDFGQCCPPED